MSNESTQSLPTGNNNTPDQQQPQYEQHQQRTATERPVEAAPKANPTSASNPASIRLVDLEAELQEMESLITAETPLQKMPVNFRTRYLAKMDQIEAKKQEIEKHVNYLIDNKLLTREDAQPFLKGINSTDLEAKRPVYGYVSIIHHHSCSFRCIDIIGTLKPLMRTE